MNTNLKVALSTVVLAAFVAAPAVAKSHTQHHNNISAPIYLNDTVVVNGRVVGADPDRHVRLEIRRDYNWYRLD
jgi:hypothetical protein